jgi:hypothetical protein
MTPTPPDDGGSSRAKPGSAGRLTTLAAGCVAAVPSPSLTAYCLGAASQTSLASVAPVPPGHLVEDIREPDCPRCGTGMIWTKASWHCLACRYKEGCCG